MLGTLLKNYGHTFGIQKGVEHLGCSSTTSLGYHASGIAFWSAQISKQRTGTIYGMHINKHRSGTHTSGKHIWNKTLEHTSGAHLSPVRSMSLPRNTGCCLASVHKPSLNPMDVITSNRACHAVPDRGPGRPPSRRTNASGLPFPPSLLAAALRWQTPGSLLYAQCRQRPLPKSLHMGS